MTDKMGTKQLVITAFPKLFTIKIIASGSCTVGNTIRMIGIRITIAAAETSNANSTKRVKREKTYQNVFFPRAITL